MKRHFIPIVVALLVSSLVSVNIAGMYKAKIDALKLSGKLLQDAINYNRIYMSKLPEMTFEELKEYEKHRLDLEIKVFDQASEVLGT